MQHTKRSVLVNGSGFYVQQGQQCLVSRSMLPRPAKGLTLICHCVRHQEKSYNFNVVVNIKRREKPIFLNVKGEGYKIHTKMVLEDPLVLYAWS